MDLVTVIIFLVLYYLRPQEWAGMFSTIHFVQVVMISGVATLFFRAHGLRPADLFRTPHDWAVCAFWLWMVLTAVSPWQTFKDNASLYIFYIVIVQSLRSIPRLNIFAAWWTLLIVGVAVLALASKWGFDPLDSLAITDGPMRGRLVLNLSIFDNPNALGHSVVPAIPMLYYYFVWRRPMSFRIAGLLLLALPLYCIYQTVSKGSFVAAGVTIVATAAFGRPKSVQALLLVAALLFGTGAMYMLPRMNELEHSKGDAAIQGRVAAFKHGYNLLQTTLHGVGKGEWGREPFITDYIPKMRAVRSNTAFETTRVQFTPYRHSKAPHSSYVCIGGELGKPGLFFFIAVLYCCLRTTMTAVTRTDDEERIRRILFVLVLSYAVSSWMVDFEYRPSFFMFTAAIAALHRHLLGLNEEVAEEESEEKSRTPVWAPPFLPQPAFAGIANQSSLSSTTTLEPLDMAPAGGLPNAAGLAPALRWNRFGWLDLGAVLVLTWLVIRFWAYMMQRM